MALNLKSVAAVETTRVHLVDASGEHLYDDAGNKVEIEIYGKASKQYRQALAELNRKNIQRKGKAQPYSVNLEDSVEILVAITKAAYNLDMGDGPLETNDQFRALYSDTGLFFIKDAIQEALEDGANFLQK